MENFLENKKHIHFIGIGGSGMYPLAQILHQKGYFLTGSDNNETDTLKAVKSMGIKVFMGQHEDNLQGADLVIYTAAIMSDNPELMAAKASGIPTLERSVLLGLISSWFEKAICVSGTHGKTSVTSMITHILLEHHEDFTAVVGGKLKAINGSGIVGNSQLMVCEACEFNDTFLQLFPNISLILNIDNDHMDYFKTMDNMIASYTKFSNLTTDYILVNGDDEYSMKAVKNANTKAKIRTFGWSKTNHFYPSEIKNISDFEYEFIFNSHDGIKEKITIFVPGRHNILNAVAACSGAVIAGCSPSTLAKGLATFHGTGRRFEKLAVVKGITIVDDYAHHPAEIQVTLEAAKAMNFKRVIAVHQPFTYSRTKALLDEFATSLSIADKVILTEIMGSREKNTYNIYSKDLAEKIHESVWFPTFDEVANFTAKFAREGDLIITLGCGDVYKIAKKLIEIL